MQLDDKEKQASLDVAEDARQTDWQAPSFVAELFKGNFNWDHIHPFPLQSDEDKKIGDDYIEVLRGIIESTSTRVTSIARAKYPRRAWMPWRRRVPTG